MADSGAHNGTASYSVTRWPARDAAVPGTAPDQVVVEEPLEIRVDGRRYSATMRTPGADEHLAVGLLLSEGIIAEWADIERVVCTTRCRDVAASAGTDQTTLVQMVDVLLHDGPRVPDHLWERALISNSSCGLCGKATVEALSQRVRPFTPHPAPDAATLLQMPPALRAHQRLFELTGGLHAAGVFRPDGELLAAFEDIGRHNATDKVLGLGLAGGWLPAIEPLTLLVSGRASFEIVQKALMAGVTTVAAVSAASSLAIDLAAANNLNLVGFLRPASFTLYTGRLME